MAPDPKQALRPGDALLVVDVQRDFCPGGALAVAGGDEVVPVLNRWMAVARAEGVPIYASRDWHPEGHASFAEQGGPWPEHCVRETPGAEFHPDLALPPETTVISKGLSRERDNYSAFDTTGLARTLKDRGIDRVWVGGLAEDVCVKATVLDGRHEGFDVHLLADATRPVDAEGGEKALEEMRGAGAVIEEG